MQRLAGLVGAGLVLAGAIPLGWFFGRAEVAFKRALHEMDRAARRKGRPSPSVFRTIWERHEPRMSVPELAWSLPCILVGVVLLVVAWLVL